jgi:hypothetical protein
MIRRISLGNLGSESHRRLHSGRFCGGSTMRTAAALLSEPRDHRPGGGVLPKRVCVAVAAQAVPPIADGKRC